MKITIGNQNNNDEQLTKAIIDAKDGDVIELLPGTYFSKDNPFICTIGRNITLIGKSAHKNDTTIYASFTIGDQNIIIFKNLNISYTANGENTLSAYDGAKVYGNNITINRQTSDDWDTIYGQNSFFSFKDSEILTGRKVKAIGISLEKSKLFADNTSIQLLFQKNSQTLLRDTKIYHKIELRRHSSLYFKDLTIDSSKVRVKNDLAVKTSSNISGQNLTFLRKNPQIRILNSRFNVDQFQPKPEIIHFKFDQDSQIQADGKLPTNHQT
ncbi:hypothetical protein COSHB9_18910 [Companilactobacillus alimentarius]|uniref:Uncharacterized protein n=1 Tax=Companilactobacillus alimentarius DSM 20249 TaxID=1423720 RepID=A0A2K9HGA3_9LACO|nr:DUF1565 domain-containing protein [Companilactobacillus alimentarius]AUI71408.1 hypothetical protein LA20249_04010 [Companilactobacillus alimentarius DSM 20249]KRK74687.1 hypothetical protein FC67_GL002104 [Companilactobacillus alimentarius DSM 20249]MDT6951264.1 DUF1565 domain-containing protein [Companilactobacillus alimentarius]GEO44401.1 hypothetical protein LAL01_06330 [Companilactobacillus alimentarius]